MARDIRIVPNKAALDKLLAGREGAAAKALSRKAIKVTSIAKAIVTEEGLVNTGRYRASIAWRLGKDGLGLFADIGSNVPYARFIEEGTPPHEIRAKGKAAGGKEALFWKGAEHPVKLVHHPGTKAQHVLARALRRAL